MEQYTAIINSPVGKIGLLTTSNALKRVDFVDSSTRLVSPKDTLTKSVVAQLDRYFDDADFEFDLPLQIEGRPFQKTVWCALRKIPVGTTKTYSQLSDELSSGPRAVGNACRRNPISIVIPCHRIVAKSGLGGFSGQRAGEKLDIKKWLLQHES